MITDAEVAEAANDALYDLGFALEIDRYVMRITYAGKEIATAKRPALLDVLRAILAEGEEWPFGGDDPWEKMTRGIPWGVLHSARRIMETH